MDGFLRHTKNALKNLTEFHTIHVAIGNEACDLDSTVSALVYAFYLHQTCQDETTLFLPVLNIPCDKYRLRTETTFLLEKLGITSDALTFSTDVDLDALHNEDKLKLTLLDHHVLAKHLSHLSKDVVLILDHRPQERDVTNCECVIEQVGSCSTLVAERILRDPNFTLDPVCATLLCGTILTDTINFSPEAGKTTSKDVEIVEQLQRCFPQLNTKSLYDEIHAAKFDLSQLTAMELLEKDFKILSGQGLTIAMSSITMDMKDFLQKENMLVNLSEFSEAKSANVVIIMTLTTSPDGLPQRQLAVYSSTRIYRHQIADVLQSSHEPHLQLEKFDLEFENIVAFNQENIQASRKKVIPVLKSFLSGEKTPEDGSKLPLEQLKSTNDGDFTALGTFTSDPADTDRGESLKDKFDDVEKKFDPFSPVETNISNSSSSEPIASSENVKDKFDDVEKNFDPFSPVETNLSNSSSSDPIASSESVKNKFDEFVENQFDPFSPVERNTGNSLSNEPITSSESVKNKFEESSKIQFDPFSPVETNMSNSSSCEPVSSPDNTAKFDMLLSDLADKSADGIESKGMDYNSNDFDPFAATSYDEQKSVNKTVNVLSVGDEADSCVLVEGVDNLINIDDTFEFTDSELQSSHVGFYLSSDSPMEVSSEANSAPGSKVSSYPVTPPNSYLDSGAQQQVTDHSLPSFNSSEMVEKLRAKQALLDNAGGLFVDAVDDDGETYTPQNSYVESYVQIVKESELPSLHTSDMVQRVRDKRNSLECFDAFKTDQENKENFNAFETEEETTLENIDNFEMEGQNKLEIFPWTPHNSFIGVGLDKCAEENLLIGANSEVGRIPEKPANVFQLDENENQSCSNINAPTSRPHPPQNSRMESWTLSDDRQTDLNKVVRRLSEVGLSFDGDAKLFADQLNISHSSVLETDESSENLSQIVSRGSDNILTQEVSDAESESFNLLHPVKSSSENVVVNQITNQMIEDSLIDINSGNDEISTDVSEPFKSHSENVVVNQIAHQMIEDSLIDVNSEDDESSTNAWEPLKSFSENVVISQIADQNIEDSLIDINSGNDEISTVVLKPMSSHSENVAISQYADQNIEDSLIDIYSGNDEISTVVLKAVSSHSENVVVNQIAQQMMEDSLIDINSGNDEASTDVLHSVKSSSENVIVNRIAQQMMEDSLIDVNSEDNESSTDMWEPLKSSSENVAIGQIVDQKVEDSLIDVNSEDNESSTDVWEPLKSSSENVAIGQIVDQKVEDSLIDVNSEDNESSTDVWEPLKSSSENVAIGQIVDQKVEDSLIDVNSEDNESSTDVWEPLKSSSENVAIGQIVDQKVEDSLIDVNSEDNESSTDVWEPLKSSSENVAIGQIVDQKVEDSLIDVNSEDNESSTDVWEPLKSSSENVAIGQIVDQKVEDSLIDVNSEDNESSTDFWEHWKSSSKNVIVNQVSQQMMEDSLIDINSGNDEASTDVLYSVKSSSENVVVNQIAQQMMEDSLIDISSGNDEISTDVLHPVKSCSENVVVNEIAQQMMGNSLIDINSGNDETSTDVLHSVKSHSENVVNQIAQQMIEDSLIDINSHDDETSTVMMQPITSSSENVVVNEIAEQMIKDSLNDINSGNDETSTVMVQPITRSSENVVANEIAEHMIEDSLNDVQSGNVENLVEALKAADRSPENVVVNQIARQTVYDETITETVSSEVSSDNVVAKLISEQMIEDKNILAEDINPENADRLMTGLESKENSTNPEALQNGKDVVSVLEEMGDASVNSVADGITEQIIQDVRINSMNDVSVENVGNTKADSLEKRLKEDEINEVTESEHETEHYSSGCHSDQNKTDLNAVGDNSNIPTQNIKLGADNSKRNCDISDKEAVQCSEPAERVSLNSPANSTDVLEVAFNLSNELLQDALESFPNDVSANRLEKKSSVEKKLKNTFTGSDYSIETEYLPEMDPLHGGLDISQDSYLIETDANKEVVESASFRKISGQSQTDVHQEMLKHLELVAGSHMSETLEEGDLELQDEVTVQGENVSKTENVSCIANQSSTDQEMLKPLESVADNYTSETPETGDLVPQDESKGQGYLDENVSETEDVSNSVNAVDVASRLNKNNNADRNDEEADEKAHKLIHVPSALATSIHESIEGNFEEPDENDDLGDSEYIKKVIHLEKEINFDSSVGADDSILFGNTTDVSFSDKHSTETTEKYSQNSDPLSTKGDNFSDIFSKGDNSAKINEDFHQTNENDSSKGDNASKGDESGVRVKKEVYMTTAGRISIAVDKDGSRTSSAMESYSGGESVSDPTAADSHRQVGSLIHRVDELIDRVDEELDVFYSCTDSLASQPQPVHSLSSQKSEGGSTSSQAENKGHNCDSVSSLEDGWQDDKLPTMLSEDGKQAVQGSGKTMAERPNTLGTSAHREKRKIVPDISLLDDDEITEGYLQASVDDMETPDDLDLPDDMDESALGELEWENDTPVRTPDDDCEALEEYSEEEERSDARQWKTVRLGDRQFRIDLKVIEPYKKVLSHGGYYGDGLNAIILFSGCYLPDRRRKDYHYVMDNLFYYVVHTLEQLVAEDYMIIYFHGATPKKQMPSFGWMKKCYQMIDRRLRKNLKALLLVHPTIWLKTVVLMTRPFISSKFSAKLRFVRTLDDLRKLVPMEYVYVPDQVQAYDDHLMKRPNLTNPSTSS